MKDIDNDRRLMNLEMLVGEIRSMLEKHIEYDIVMYIISKREKSEGDSQILSKLDIVEELVRELLK